MITEKININIINHDGEIVREITIDKKQIDSDKGVQAVHDTIVFYRNNLRSWTASTKTRGLVRGGGVKPYRQKGTGRSRAGSIRSPIRVGGGTIFGPDSSDKPARKKLNKKVISLALNKIFTDKLINSKIKFLDDLVLNYEDNKIKNTLTILKNLDIIDNKILIIVKNFTDNLIRSTLNISNVELRNSNSVNAYDILKSDCILFSESSIVNFIDRLNRPYIKLEVQSNAG